MTIKWSPSELDDLIESYRKGATTKALGKRYGVSPKVVIRQIRLAFPDEYRGPTGLWEPPDLDALIDSYNSGVSVKRLAERYGVDRNTITRCVRHLPNYRGRSDAMYVRMAQTSPEERLRLTDAAHDAVRGRKRSLAELELTARSREGKLGKTVSPAELELGEMLRAEGFDVVHQKAVGKYNVDVAADSVGVEILGGSWHRVKRHGERLRYLLESGWDVIYIWVDQSLYPLGPGAAQYVVSHLKFRQSNPSAPRCYRVIRGSGQFLAGGSADGDDIPDVLPNHDGPEVAPAEVPFGYCHCGCGRKAPVSLVTKKSAGWVRGQPKRFLSGHNSRRPRDPR